MKLFALFFLLSITSFSQEYREIYLKDSKTNQALMFATVINQNTKFGYVTNSEGNVRVTYFTESDVLKISYVGYENRFIAIKDIPVSGIILIAPRTIELNEAKIVGYNDQNFIANMLRRVIKANKKHVNTKESRATLITESIIDNLPLERQESIGNATISTNSIEEYEIKIGRFGQNKQFNFYTLTATHLFSNFEIFQDLNNTDFPTIITRLSNRKIKKNYSLSYAPSKYEGDNLMKIGFESNSGEEFSGELLFELNTLKLRSIVFTISNPKERIFIPVIEGHQVELNKLKYEVNFLENEHAVNFVKIDYELNYTSDSTNRITSTSWMSFQTNQDVYTNHYYTGEVQFKGEYHQILFNTFDQRFWEENFNYANSNKVSKTYDFFKNYGYIANYQKYSSDSILDFLDLKIANWDTTRLSMKKLNHNSMEFNINVQAMLGEETKNTIRDLYNFEANYYFQEYLYLDSTKRIDLIPKFDYNESYYFLSKDWQTEVCMNLGFDIFQKNVGNQNSKEEVNQLYNKSNAENDRLNKNTERGKKLDSLIVYNKMIKNSLGINNIKVLFDREFRKSRALNAVPNYYNVGTAYLLLNDYENALLYFDEEYAKLDAISGINSLSPEIILSHGFTKDEKDQLIDLLFNRAQTYIGLEEYEKACADFKFAHDLGDEESGIMLKIHCSD